MGLAGGEGHDEARGSLSASPRAAPRGLRPCVLIGSKEKPDPLAAMRGPWAPCSPCTFRGGLYLGSDARPGCMCINGVWIGIRPLAGFVPVLAKEVQATVG